MTHFTETVEAFYALVQHGQFLEAVDRFYDENIVSTDNNNDPTKGIDNFRKAVEQFAANTQLEKLELLSTIIDQNLTVAHWHYIFTHKTFGKMDYRQVSVQRWSNGKIIQENHFYNLF
jgi:ketosteroid isomerase-like protein